jgi:putative 2OG-Fe(II) oxygenase
MDESQVLTALRRLGFASAGQLVLTPAEAAELAALSRKAFEEIRTDQSIGGMHPDYIPPKSGVEGVMRIPQQNARIAQLLDKVVSNEQVRQILDGALGPDYKVWQANYRRSIPGDPGLYLHQDGYGETNICILLSNNSTGAGATLFAPGSHLVRQTMKQWRVEAPPLLVRLLGFLLTPLTGRVGDIAFFFNRTWHARARNPGSQPQDVILISFFPAGATIGYEGYGEWSSAFLASVRDTRLGMLLDPSIGTERQPDGLYRILDSQSSIKGGTSYSLAIDKGEVPRNNAGGVKLATLILTLRTVFAVGRPLWHMIRVLVPRGAK